MPDYTRPERAEAPRLHVVITNVDIPALVAVGVDRKNQGSVTIDLSLTQGQTITYPRQNEEWFLEKINENWVLGHKAGFGNEGLLRDSQPGDLVTVTTGEYHLETGPVTITGETTFENNISIGGDLMLFGEFKMGGAGDVKFKNILTGNITSSGHIQAQTMQVIYDLQVLGINAYGDINSHGNSFRTENGNLFYGSGGVIGTGALNVGNITCKQLTCDNIYPKQVSASAGLFATFGQFSGAISCTTIGATAIGCSSVVSSGNVATYADLTGTNVRTSSNAIIGGSAYADTFVATGPVYGSGLIAPAASVNGSIRFNSSTGSANVMYRDGSYYQWIYALGFGQATSWRSIKENFLSIEEWVGQSAIDIVTGLEISAWNYIQNDDAPGDDSTRFGLMLDELPRELRVKNSDPENPEKDTSSYDLGTMLNVALAAIKDQQKLIDALTTRVADLEAAAA